MRSLWPPSAGRSANMLAELVQIKTGAGTIVAADGDAAVKLWRAEQPSVVILDLNMPFLDGIEVRRQSAQRLPLHRC